MTKSKPKTSKKAKPVRQFMCQLCHIQKVRGGYRRGSALCVACYNS